MNISQVLLIHWYAGCALIGNLLIVALDRHAKAINKETIPEIDSTMLIEDSWNLGIACGNNAHHKITRDIQTEILKHFKQLPTPEQGS